VHLQGLTFVRQLEHSVGDDEVVLRAKVEEPEIIVIDVSDSVFRNDVTPDSVVISSPCTELAKQKGLVSSGDTKGAASELHTESIFHVFC